MKEINIKNEYFVVMTIVFAVSITILFLFADMPSIFELGPYIIVISASLMYPLFIVSKHGLKFIANIIYGIDSNIVKCLVSFLIAFYFVSAIMNILTFDMVYGMCVINSIIVLHLVFIQEIKSQA